MDSLQLLRKLIREEIGRNFHTIKTDPYTFEDFQDYDLEINGNTLGEFFLTVFFKGKKIMPTQKFASHSDAHHAARVTIDKDRVNRMNHEKKQEVK